MRRRVEPFIALELLLVAVTADLVKTQDDLQQFEGVAHLAEDPVVAFGDYEALANGQDAYEKQFKVDLDLDDLRVILGVLERLDGKDKVLEEVDEIDDHHNEQAHEVGRRDAAARARDLHPHRYLDSIQPVPAHGLLVGQHGPRISARALQFVFDGIHPFQLR